MTLLKARCGNTWKPWMTKEKRHKAKKMDDSVRREMDCLIESLSFEPINFHEVKARIRHLMSIEGKRK